MCQGMVLANRSALWVQLGEPGLAEEDCGLALEAGGQGQGLSPSVTESLSA